MQGAQGIHKMSNFPIVVFLGVREYQKVENGCFIVMSAFLPVFSVCFLAIQFFLFRSFCSVFITGFCKSCLQRTTENNIQVKFVFFL
jgi:hypothetical protein